MNILFFLKPKESVVYLKEDFTLRQAMEKMEIYRFSAIPVITNDGKYLGTLSEGDILWHFKHLGEFDLKESEKTLIKDITHYKDNKPIHINQDMSDLINISKQENFIPVIDDREMFIGIITRQDILNYFYNDMVKKNVVKEQ